MKKLTLLSIIPLAIIMADMNFPTSTQKGDSMSVVSAEAAPVNTPGIIPNSLDLIWDDTYGGNTHFTTATSTSQGQYNPSKPPFEIGTPSYRVPTANMWLEIELEGTDTSCSHSINKATNTRVEIAGYEGWWMDDNDVWHDMVSNSRGGSSIPTTYMQTSGLRGCYQDYFKEAREGWEDIMKDEIVNPGKSNDRRGATEHIFIKVDHYYRWHGWGSKTVFPTETTIKAMIFQVYMRLAVDDESLPDDRHLARYVAHTGSDRKEYDGKQLWNMGISRFKRVTNDWQPFNLTQGILTFEELEANPPPFTSVP